MHSSRWIQVVAALSLVFSLTAQASRADDFRLLEIGSLHVKWGAAALGKGAGTVTYGFVRSPLAVSGARNCPTVVPADGIAAAAGVDRRRFEALAAEGITGGCGGGNYCPQSPVRRDQMAVFLLKAEHGSAYVPPDCAGTFADVACPSTFANWIEQLAAETITGGCGNGNYCPLSNNTRGQMAVFISKAFSLQ